jgi:hypothetical protein
MQGWSSKAAFRVLHNSQFDQTVALPAHRPPLPLTKPMRYKLPLKPMGTSSENTSLSLVVHLVETFLARVIMLESVRFL